MCVVFNRTETTRIAFETFQDERNTIESGFTDVVLFFVCIVNMLSNVLFS